VITEQDMASNNTNGTDSRTPLSDTVCPYCEANEVYFKQEQVGGKLDRYHRTVTCDRHWCGQCNWELQNYQYETAQTGNRSEYRGVDRGFRERIPEGHVLLVRPVDSRHVQYEIVGRVDGDAPVPDEHREMLDAGKMESYLGELDATSDGTPTIRYLAN